MEVRPGWASRRARKSNSLADFYLAGRGLGVPVLVLTLYAPQYSGNSLIGYRGEAYRMGFSWMMTVGFMMSIVVVYLTYAPKLQRISRGLGFVTPADWIEHRFGLAPLTHVANLLLVAAITNSWRGLKAKPALLGIVLGALAAVIPTLAGWERLWGFHAGVLGLALNVLVGVTGSLWLARREHG